MSRSPSARDARATDDRAEVHQTAAALQLFFVVAGHWDLTGEEARTLLGSPPRSTFFRWKRGEVGGVGRDTLERVAYVVGIDVALHTLFSDDRFADAWIRRPNGDPLFNGRPALQRMLASVGELHTVYRHVAAEAAGNAGW